MMSSEAEQLYTQGCHYYYGTDGSALNHRKAVDCFRKAANMGFPAAMNFLGILYQEGSLVERDHKEALAWFHKALQANPAYAPALLNVARLHYNGTGVVQNLSEAERLCRAAIAACEGSTESPFPQSCHLLGCLILNRGGNYAEAYSSFEQAAHHGNIAEAWYNLGWLVEKGHSPSHSFDTSLCIARIFYENAANLGYMPAIEATGRLYLACNMPEEARPWLEKASSLGYDSSNKLLKLLNLSQGGSLWSLFR